MSVRFASANNPARRLGWRAAGRGLIAPALARAVNDNGAALPAEGLRLHDGDLIDLVGTRLAFSCN